MTVEKITEAHLGAIAEIEREVFAAPWSREALRLLVGESAFGFAAVEAGEVLAYGGMLCVLDEGQILNVATREAARRRGLARAVLLAMIAEARARSLSFLTLEVRESNEAAILLYTSLGFQRVGKRPHFYTHPAEAALLMRFDTNG